MNRGAIAGAVGLVIVAGVAWAVYGGGGGGCGGGGGGVGSFSVVGIAGGPDDIAAAAAEAQDDGVPDGLVLSNDVAEASRLRKVLKNGGKKVTRLPSRTPKSQSPQQQAKPTASSAAIRRRADYVKQADEATEVAWQFMNAKDGWSKEKGGDGPQPSVVYSKSSSKYGKMFKLEATLDVSPELITRDMAANAANMPKWNPTLLEVKVIEVLDNKTAVLYNVAAPAAGGVVSSRDFVFLTRQLLRDGWYSSCIVSTSHAAAPPVSNYIRGDQAPGCMRFRSTGDGQSRFEWMLNTNLKGWLLQYTVDSAMSGVMLQYLEYLKKHCAELKAAAAVANS